MISFCADDYGLHSEVSEHIRECAEKKALQQVSAFANMGQAPLPQVENLCLSLHLNLVEGKCMADHAKVDLIADESGAFRYTFTGLLWQNLRHPKKLEAQLSEEIRAQISAWKKRLPPDHPIRIDSHQHTLMIPAVWSALISVLREEKIPIGHLRVPAEPILPFLQTPSLYFTYRPINLIKQWLLNVLWQYNRRKIKDLKIPTKIFFGILFSGKMDEKRVRKILPKFVRMAEKKGKEIEVLFHPGYIKEKNVKWEDSHVVFQSFYLSESRKTEFDSVMNLSERRDF